MFIFNNNKPQLDFMFSEDNVLVGKKTNKKKAFKRYFSFKQIHYGKYFFVHLIFQSKLQFVYISRHTTSISQKQ